MKKTNGNKKEHGFTLIEIIIGIVMIGLVIGIVSTVSVSTWRSQKYGFEKSANIENERQIIIYLSNEIRNATKINSPINGNTTTSISYQIQTNNNPDERTISLGSGSEANTILIKDATGITIKRLGTARVKTLQFQSDPNVPKKIIINLTMINLPGSNTPGNNISTIIYPLN